VRARRWLERGLLHVCVLLGCRPEPLRPVVEEIELEGLRAVKTEPLLEGLATSETPTVLGFEGIREYTTYDPHVLARDLLRIERYLRAHGYYDAKVTSARVVDLGDNRVRIEIRVHEGQPVRVTNITGIAGLPVEATFAATAARKLTPGAIFDEQIFEDDKTRVERVLLDLGYAFAKVRGEARVNVARRTAALTYQISIGPRARYGPVTFVGLREIPEDKVRATLSINEGESYSEAELLEARGELVDLGVFATVDIVPDRSHPETAIVPIQVRVREAALRTLRLGGGVRFDVLRLMTRLETSWEHRNFLGGMRTFNVNARPGLTFFPTSIENLVPPTRLLPENRVVAKLSQPSFIEGRTTGTLKLSYDVAPVLYPLGDIPPEEEPIIGYHEIRASAGVSRHFFDRRLSIEPSYNWQANFPFMYQLSRPNGLDPVRVAYPELVVALDLRDDARRTRKGVYISNSLQIASRTLGGTVSDVKVSPELRAFAPVDRSMIGARITFGFLFPGNYGSSLTRNNPTPSDVDVIHDQQKLNLRAFYSGGPNSNRGYPYRTIGPHGAIGFLAPSSDRDCTMELASDDRCLRPLGGLTLWEASLETRIPFAEGSPIEGVLFLDASDLTRTVGELRFTVPHISPGAGLRYVTPVGPLRLDVGWRVPGLQAFGADDTEENIGRPGDPLFGFFPGAVHVVFGSEAF
jgi:outer membrane protein insertion porin family/translocation and assembly module TamA